MSLKPKISAKETKDGLVIYDLTGIYGSSNTGGFGTPNPSIASVTLAQFEIYFPEATTPLIISVLPDFPTTDKELGYEVLLAQLGVDFIESGVWKIGYRINGTVSGIDYEKYCEKRFVFTQSAVCCVDKLVSHTANVPVNVFMKDDKKKAAVELSALLKDALWAKECKNYDAAGTILKFINLQCKCC